MFTTIGEELLARNAKGDLRVQIATVFPHARTVVALHEIPMHAYQRAEFAAGVDRDRIAKGLPPLTEAEHDAQMDQGVDLIVDERGVLIRPDPQRMSLALEADELLQEQIPKRMIKFLFLSDPRIGDTLKRRGECWRMFQPPTSEEQIRQVIFDTRSAIEGLPIYFYSPVSGTRFLTYQNLQQLTLQNDDVLRKHLVEIATYSGRRNHHGCCEIEFFMLPNHSSAVTAQVDAVSKAAPTALRSEFLALCNHLRAQIPAAYQHDDLDETEWRCKMFERLMTQGCDSLADYKITGLDRNFSMRVEWLPGARIEEGELILDPAIEEAYGGKLEKHVPSVVPGLILNLAQEFSDLEYINLASVLPSPKRNEERRGRREVYVAQIKHRAAAKEILQVIRMQKWGVWENLDEGMSLEEAMLKSEEYTEYVLDRRVACRQMGMNLKYRQTTRKVSEYYNGINRRYAGKRIWSPYFQRDYMVGNATDQITDRKLSDRAYAMSFARLLGQAAASNIILGRAELTGEAIFDVSDEIVVEDAEGMPTQIIVCDHVGTFVDWTGKLESRAAEYAKPIAARLKTVPEPQEFVDSYLAGFLERFIRVQEECNRHRRAFDNLFKYRPWDPAGSPAFRWSRVIQRLRDTDVNYLAQLIRHHIPYVAEVALT